MSNIGSFSAAINQRHSNRAIMRMYGRLCAHAGPCARLYHITCSLTTRSIQVTVEFVMTRWQVYGDECVGLCDRWCGRESVAVRFVAVCDRYEDGDVREEPADRHRHAELLQAPGQSGPPRPNSGEYRPLTGGYRSHTSQYRPRTGGYRSHTGQYCPRTGGYCCWRTRRKRKNAGERGRTCSDAQYSPALVRVRSCSPTFVHVYLCSPVFTCDFVTCRRGGWSWWTILTTSTASSATSCGLSTGRSQATRPSLSRS